MNSSRRQQLPLTISPLGKRKNIGLLNLKGILSNITWGIATTILTAFPTDAAEKIYLTYQGLQFSLKVESLAQYAKTGEVNSDLGFYLGFVSEQQQKDFQAALTEKADIEPVLLSRLLNTKIGEDILRRLGSVINIPWNLDGKYAIRGALVQAAFEPEGLTLLGFLQKFPTNLQLDISRALLVSDEIGKIVSASEAMIAEMEQLSEREAQAETKVNFAELPDLSQPGPYGSVSETVNLTDASRQRKLRVIFYYPEQWQSDKTPVLVLSHGLASRPEDFSDISQHLASHGYFVALPQHPGSDYQQAQDLIEGYSRVVFQLDEFVDRPADVSFVLDYLEQQNQARFGGRLNLARVGVMGHSFGGYTALAIAGGEIDFDFLARECDLTRPRLNTSLLLQCRALDLPRKPHNFRDERVAAVLTLNPVNSSIFGPVGLSKIDIPLFMIAGTYDPATPAVFEQFRSFPWVRSANKYLGLVEGQAHIDFADLDPGISEAVDSLNVVTLPAPQVIKKYGFSLALAFSEVYVRQNQNFLPYMESISQYGQYMSEGEEFKIFAVSGESSAAIAEKIAELGIN